MPMWFVSRFVTTLPSAIFGMVCLFCGSLRHRARDPVNVAFSNLRSLLLEYSNRLRCFAPPLWRRALHPTTSQRHVMPTSHAPLFSFHLFLSSSLSSLHSNILLPHILCATSPPSLKKRQIPIMSSRKGTKEERIFPNERLTNFFSRFWDFSYVL